MSYMVRTNLEQYDPYPTKILPYYPLSRPTRPPTNPPPTNPTNIPLTLFGESWSQAKNILNKIDQEHIE